MPEKTCIMVTKVDEGWMYEGVYTDTKEHAFNLDVLFRYSGNKYGEYEKLMDQRWVILPDKLDPKKCSGYILRPHSNDEFRWH